jgi:HAD superfamily phosphatase
VIYVGDTVADMHTIAKVRQVQPDRPWFAVGVLPPHVQATAVNKQAYIATLQQAGAQVVYDNVQELTVEAIDALVRGEERGERGEERKF